MQNIGSGPVNSALGSIPHKTKNALITTVAYQFGNNPAVYALEGSVAIAGAAVTWLRDNMQLVKNYSDVEFIANQDSNSAGVYFVPALQGLYAPFWDPKASGTVIGLTQFSKKCHFVRATLEGVAFQANDILMMMKPKETGIKVDGGMCSNNLLCQFLADISDCKILRPKSTEATALGAALISGYTLQLWPHLVDLVESKNDSSKLSSGKLNSTFKFENNSDLSIRTLFDQDYDVFEPLMKQDLRKSKIRTWNRAINRCLNWFHEENQEIQSTNYKRLSTLPFMIYALVSFGAHIISTTTES